MYLLNDSSSTRDVSVFFVDLSPLVAEKGEIKTKDEDKEHNHWSWSRWILQWGPLNSIIVWAHQEVLVDPRSTDNLITDLCYCGQTVDFAWHYLVSRFHFFSIFVSSELLCSTYGVRGIGGGFPGFDPSLKLKIYISREAFNISRNDIVCSLNSLKVVRSSFLDFRVFISCQSLSFFIPSESTDLLNNSVRNICFWAILIESNRFSATESLCHCLECCCSSAISIFITSHVSNWRIKIKCSCLGRCVPFFSWEIFVWTNPFAQKNFVFTCNTKSDESSIVCFLEFWIFDGYRNSILLAFSQITHGIAPCERQSVTIGVGSNIKDFNSFTTFVPSMVDHKQLLVIWIDPVRSQGHSVRMEVNCVTWKTWLRQ